MSILDKEVPTGQRKVTLTRHGLMWQSIVIICYLAACTLTNTQIPDTFIMWVMMGYASITGTSHWANSMEHKYRNPVTGEINESNKTAPPPSGNK